MRRIFELLGRARTLYFVGKLLVAAGLVAAVVAAWIYLLHDPPWVIVAFVFVGAIAIVGAALTGVAVYLYGQPNEGCYSPRYLAWYRWPIRKVSWDFGNYLGGKCSRGSPVLVSSFRARYNINWSEGIRPRKAYIECKRTSSRQNVLIECGNPYVSAEECEFVPRGKWYAVQSQFDEPGLTKEQFLEKWDGFTFVFEYDTHVFKRTFPRAEIEIYYDRYWQYCNRSSEPTPSRRQR